MRTPVGERAVSRKGRRLDTKAQGFWAQNLVTDNDPERSSRGGAVRRSPVGGDLAWDYSHTEEFYWKGGDVLRSDKGWNLYVDEDNPTKRGKLLMQEIKFPVAATSRLNLCCLLGIRGSLSTRCSQGNISVFCFLTSFFIVVKIT